MSKELIKSLLEALQVSPDNNLLRLQVADLMQKENLWDESVLQYQKILERNNRDIKALSGLANSYYLLQKFSAAIIVFEQMEDNLSNADQLLFVKSLLKENSIPQATTIYQQLLSLHPEMADEEIDAQLRLPFSASPASSDLISQDDPYIMEKPNIRFSDVGGMHKIKEEISVKIIQPLQNPELYKAFGKKIGGGILLYGPPGCGKTFIAKATAGEINAKFINIGLHDILDMWIGNSEKNLHEIFEVARQNTPCVLFFDEVDAMGASRSDMKQSGMRHVINQFLAELDGVEGDNDGLLILAATNAPWSVDGAFRRPGRFDRVIFVEPPDEEAREEILKAILRNKPTDNIEISKIAAITKDFSGADIMALVDIAIEEKLRESMSKGSLQPLSTKDLLKASKIHRPTTLEWFSSARNYALYSNESGQYDDILRYLKLKK